MAEAMTNEERFVASCASEGEVNVRQKLNSGRYSGRKAVWADTWLDVVEAGKSDATKADEQSRGLLKAKTHNRFFFATPVLLLVLLVTFLIALVMAK